MKQQREQEIKNLVAKMSRGKSEKKKRNHYYEVSKHKGEGEERTIFCGCVVKG